MRERLLGFILLSLLLHFLLGTGLESLGGYSPLSQKKTDARPIDVTLLPPPQAKVVDKQTVLDAAVPKELQVDSQEEADLLSARHQRVKKQTVARDFGVTANSPVQTTRTGKSGLSGKKELQGTSEGASRASDPRGSKQTQANGRKKNAGLILSTDPFSSIAAADHARGKDGRDDKSQSDREASAKFAQRMQALSMGDGGRSMINERIPGVESANITALNTNPYLYYSFYSRMVSQVRYHWENNLASVVPGLTVTAAQRFPNREEWQTQISMYVDEKGRVIRVDIDRSSGLSDLDYAVVRAMYSGGPYRNPPTEMAENGEIRVQMNFNLYWQPSTLVNRR